VGSDVTNEEPTDLEEDVELDPGASQGEPSSSLRGLSPHERGSMSFDVIERGHAASASLGRTTVVDDPDSELVARWQGGDERAFELLVRRHEQRVFRLLLRMMGSREEAEDVAQETFLSLHRNGHRFRAEARFSTFVYRVAANAALNRRRTLGRTRDRISKLQVRHAAGDDLPQSPRDPEDAAMGAETSARVQEALDRLSPSLRFPVVLYDIEGLPYGEIARILGVAEGTVKSRIHRARQALRTELRGLAGRSNEGATS
jgi:RNA polymerase sigma-70 factor (ECF subfamily)